MSIPRLRVPIVLVHGLLGFSAVRVFGKPLLKYFHGIEDALESAGNRVLGAGLSPTAGIAQRAAELRTFLNREVPSGPVHILAHSMGGLDARYMISKLGMESRVLSLTTIGTPHRGSPFADWGVRRLSLTLKPIARLFDLPDQAFFDLTTESCRAFNADVPDVSSVRYFSVAGRCSDAWLAAEWLFPHTVVSQPEGDNDGLVSVTSATYGEASEVWDGDHLSLINWPNRVAQRNGCWQDRTAQYAGLICRLADAGF
jgi:triacylglycerol lipase